MEWMILPLKRYAQFNGRSRRKEFWMWVLFVFLVSIVLTILDSMLGLGGRTFAGPSSTTTPMMTSFGYGAAARGGLLTTIFSFATLIPYIAVSVRRLHDTDRSGWWILLPLLPILIGFGFIGAGAATGNPALMLISGVAMLIGFICAILVLVWYCLPGTQGSNRFGPDPLDDTGEALVETFQ
jgi:uncharacterized membrane protein YhaH (DUF805 family)